MIDFYTLIDLKLSPDEFMDKALNFNILKLQHNPSLRLGYESFYHNLAGLSEFGQINYREKIGLKIYAENIGRNSFLGQKTIFHAIDETGLVHGSIFGPSLELVHPFANSDLAKKVLYPNPCEFYGTLNVGASDDYDYIVKMYAKSYEESIPVNLAELRNKYLPLRRGYQINDNRYFDLSPKADNYHRNAIIYKSNDRSFEIPFYQLLATEEKLPDWQTSSFIPKLNEDCVSFQLEKYNRTFKYEYTQDWAGKISYDTFEIIAFEFLGESKEYIG
jgi:hypothetical protein